jgi:hypothetical protein
MKQIKVLSAIIIVMSFVGISSLVVPTKVSAASIFTPTVCKNSNSITMRIKNETKAKTKISILVSGGGNVIGDNPWIEGGKTYTKTFNIDARYMVYSAKFQDKQFLAGSISQLSSCSPTR